MPRDGPGFINDFWVIFPIGRTADSVCIVVVRFKSIGSAPIMKNNVFKATAGHKFQAVIMFLRQQLGMKKEDSLVSQP